MFRKKEKGSGGLQSLSPHCMCMFGYRILVDSHIPFFYRDLSNEIQDPYFLKPVSDGYEEEIRNALVNSSNLISDFYVSSFYA